MKMNFIKKIKEFFTSKTDVDGSYTGNAKDGGKVEQDVDDL